MMPWRKLRDPDNPENRNAGNGGDLVKHTIYLTALRALAAPGMRIRECHAGRGVYQLAPDDGRQPLLERLRASDTLLAAAQRQCLDALGIVGDERRRFYVGSGLLSAWALSGIAATHHAYEWDPQTRQILATVRRCAGFGDATIYGDAGRHFDGESHIADHIDDYDHRDVVLLDPFGLWIHGKHRERRARYRRIVDGMVRRREHAPAMVMFWTWGGAHDRATADLSGNGSEVRDGYQQLASAMCSAGHHPVTISWRTDLSFAMWVIAPLPLRVRVKTELERACHELLDALGLDLDLQVR